MLEEDERWYKTHDEPLFSSHMIDLSEETVDFNLSTTAKYFKRAAAMKQWLEMVGLNVSCSLQMLNGVTGNWHHGR